MGQSHPKNWDELAHQKKLLGAGRCGRCAEDVSRAAIVQGAACPHCGSRLGFEGGDLLGELQARRLKWRIFGYALVAAASFVAGLVPLLQVVVQVLALFVLHVIVLRRSLQWLSTARRVLARISIKLLGAAIATASLLINAAIAPLLGASAVVLAAVGPLLSAVYVEGGLVILRRRLRWQADERPLRTAEWILPVGMLVSLLVAVAATVVIVAGTLQFLASSDIPSVGQIAKTLLELSP